MNMQMGRKLRALCQKAQMDERRDRYEQKRDS